MCSFVMSTSVTMTEGCHLTSEVVGTVVGRVLVGTATAYARLFSTSYRGIIPEFRALRCFENVRACPARHCAAAQPRCV